MLRITTVAFAAFALSACVPTAPSSPSSGVAEEDEPIIGGMNSDATQNSVIRISVRSDAGIYECSGTLLAPNLVLTARHCVSATADESVGCTSKGVGDAGGMVFGDFDPAGMTIGYGNTRGRGDGGMFGGMRPSGDAGVRPHAMKIFHDESTNLCNHDLALILLDTKIAGALISPIRLDSPPEAGETFTAVGWGVTSTTPNPSTRQERTDVAITAVGPSNDFGGVAPNEFLIGEAICSGDSGGPALDSDTNAIIGVVSRGGNGLGADPNNPAAGCIGARNIYTQVMPFSDMIMEAYSEAGAQPWLEGMPNPNLGATGDACSTGTACQSGMCLGGNDAGGGICTQECTVYVCPDGLECQNGLGTRVCGPPGHGGKGGCSTQPSPSSDAPSALWLVLPLIGFAALRLRRRLRA